MKIEFLSIILLALFYSACGQINNAESQIIAREGEKISSRILPPDGYTRSEIEKASFATYLRNLPLKPDGSLVKYYNGWPKPNLNVYAAVIDLPIGKRDLHQCADAVMRLRAEYLWQNEQYDDIHFNFTNGFRANYSKWRQGYRISVKGNDVNWYKATEPSNTYKTFWKYMEMVFSYAGTLSLNQELNPVTISDMKIGDVFIQGGSPGHAVIVVDMAENDAGKKIFLLAQSYMPAQETQILLNGNNEQISPWYSEDFGDILKTPEWEFKSTDLKRF